MSRTLANRLGRPRHLDFSVVGGREPQGGGGPTLQKEYVVRLCIEGERLGPNEQKMEVQNGLGVEPYYKMVLTRVKPKAAAILKRSKEDPQKEGVYIDAIERNKYLHLFMTSDRGKEGGINEMGRPGMIKLKEGCDAIVQDLLLPYVNIPMEEVFSSLSREAQMAGVGGLKYPEYNRKVSLKVRHIAQDYLTNVQAMDQTFVAAGEDHACAAKVCVLLTKTK
uniref:Uncharacterized protein n=1 Tax=Chromera velia CCMP2878 TaxID=1169474 RepID=A0A0G4G6Y8_9ALVE|eukprot:Cvel_20491.t1-p1 / transcript=Cvel_20491.t1 / gene=Cvel_20491 / organism=Chromera_velia_CCMP2878 / gene_product=hypothetical protein / transcript_product=hypothetical protein / location=Cvel_scaffold1843:60-722(-) / protein_length=221 / sequence_SO=supercontig / SO=protein_coding / is_pseudo=false